MTDYPLPAEFAGPNDVVTGPDGALWASDGGLGLVWRITPSGRISSFDSAAAVVDRVRPRRALDPRPQPGPDRQADPAVNAAGTTFEVRAGKRFERSGATSRDADPNANPRDHDVTISWGDGRRSRGSVHRTADGGFAVRGSHEYSRARSHRIVVRIDDGVGKGADAVVESTALVRR